jgi:hypothetical protein
MTGKTELKALVPEDAREAAGHGVRAKQSKNSCSDWRACCGGCVAPQLWLSNSNRDQVMAILHCH